MSLLKKVDELENPGPWILLAILLVFFTVVIVVQIEHYQKHVEVMKCIEFHTPEECNMK